MIKKLLALSFAATIAGFSATRTDSEVRNDVNTWMTGHPVMGGRSISTVQTHPNTTTPGAVSVVSLAPKGTIVVNRDTRLPMIVMFTADETIQDFSQFNEQVGYARQRLEALGPDETFVGIQTSLRTNLYVPAMFQTNWGQWAPYNLYMPANPKSGWPIGSKYRAVTGCGTIGMAQILNHYQWPPYGENARTHKDNWGNFNPTFSTNFDHVYRWDLMKNNYDLNDSGPSSEAIGRLVYDLATLGSIDCESDVSGINLDHTGFNLGTYMFYEKENIVVGDIESRQVIEENLRKGIPVPADITINQNGDGHAIVFDGLLINNGSTSYHTNYGWNGQYNLWWDKDAIFAVWQAKPGIRPALIPLPTRQDTLVKQGESVKLPWKIATQRKSEAQTLNLYKEGMKSGTWEEDCEDLPVSADRRSWSLDTDSISGYCWKANSPYPSDYLTIADAFIPTADTVIQFQEKHKCLDNYVDIEVSVNGNEYQTIHTIGRDIQEYWKTRNVALGQFAGKQIKLRLGYHAPPMSGFYSNEQFGGVWIDNMRVINTLVKGWELVDTIPANEFQNNGHDSFTTHPKLANLPLGSHNFSASIIDANGVEHREGSSFTLTVANPIVRVVDNFSVIYQNRTKVSGTTLNMGVTKIGKAKSIKFVIKNTGTKPLRNIQVKIYGTGRKAFTTTLGTKTLPPGAKTTVVIKFKPGKVQPYNMTAKVSSENNNFQMKIRGKGGR